MSETEINKAFRFKVNTLYFKNLCVEIISETPVIEEFFIECAADGISGAINGDKHDIASCVRISCGAS